MVSANGLAGGHRGHYFVDVPGIVFSIAARLNPHQGIEPRSIETSLDFGKVNLQLDVIQKLLKVVPADFKVDCHHWLILHGRYTCVARKPRCGSCLIEDLCEFTEKTD